ncbi:invasion associated locus B family protein [Sphingomonas xinjiangensis]|uniref:Invasion protein IalB, involved in pathogenesis n=1 Tax=Sphingomonas xinjiangensis TaxID=643568 RepID=A0A840YRE3_9SPHN|nr:invasion associated locus B family protein [Sphingomonas xinjiangensis]MBB5712211.1 hypothetical protein [Sphingomonas xinjiangensis]
MIALALALALLFSPRDALGVYEGWAAFRDASPLRCYAIAKPVRRGSGAFASVGTWPRAGARNQIHIRLSKPRRADARVTLSIGERRFELRAGPSDAWAPDARTDAAVVAAMREGRSMSVETVDAEGAPFVHSFSLKGAATAIDAAALGCVRF